MQGTFRDVYGIFYGIINFIIKWYISEWSKNVDFIFLQWFVFSYKCFYYYFIFNV